MGRISMPQGRGSQLHNRREYSKIGRAIPDNINTDLSSQNITLVDKDIRQAYQDIFGQALDEYNHKQTRSDRRIDSYYDHIAKSKNGEKTFYEDVIQWGAQDDFLDPQTRYKAREALITYTNTFEQRNPNLKLIGAYIHMDEASPHLHLDYIPVAHGYSRGLSTRNSLDKAMKEMGFIPDKESRINNATKLWKNNERAYLGKICKSLNLEVEEERESRGSLSVAEYKEARDKMLETIEQEYSQKKEQLKKVDEITSFIAADTLKAENMFFPEKRSFWGKIETNERTGVFVENVNQEQVQALIQRVKADEKIEAAFEHAKERENEIIASAQNDAKIILAEASAKRNQTIAEAQQIIDQKHSILTKAKDFAKDIKKKYKKLVNQVNTLLKQKDLLEAEITEIQSKKNSMLSLKAEVDELEKARDMLHGKLDYELAAAKFKDWHTMPFGANYDIYRERGDLIALYNDGTVRKVGSNEHGGFDHKTLEDQRQGLCKVGIMQEEEQVRIPKSLLQELIRDRNKNLAMSSRLKLFIQRQFEAEAVINKHKKSKSFER